MFRTIGILLLVTALVLMLDVFYHNSPQSEQPVVFSARQMMDGLWHAYKITYIEASTGRTVDPSKDNISTSEGESYAMLRAVWWDDKSTFDNSWAWTQKYIQHRNDHLFSWLYGPKPDGSYGVLTSLNGQNSASDADSDIALALIFAHDRWGDQAYLTQAQAILKDIWSEEVVFISGKPYLLANNVEKLQKKDNYIMDPSYLAPYEYRIFAHYDPNDNWLGLVDTSYKVISDSASLPLDKKSSAMLPPNWVLINKNTAALSPSSDSALSTDYGYDAMRIPFRLAVDWYWFKDSRDQQILSKFSFLESQWHQHNLLYATYGHDGTVTQNNEAPAMYGGAIGYFMLEDPAAAKQIYDSKLKVLYNPDNNSWIKTLNYYDDNWSWFGLALYNNFIINLDNNNER